MAAYSAAVFSNTREVSILMCQVREVFWWLLGCVAYAYVGYPAALWLTSALARRRHAPSAVSGHDCPPHVSIVVPSYNEAALLERRIANLLALDYPSDRLDIIVGSDGSTDRTDAVVSAVRDPRVRLISVPHRGGKTALLNMLINVSSADVIVFTDANSDFAPDAIARLVEPFADPTIGCVTGELVYSNRSEAGVRAGEGLYWRLEDFVKDMEGRFGGTLVATGAIYAMRRRLCAPLPAGISDDSVNPLLVLRSGHRVVVQPRAHAFEREADNLAEEYRRKVRMVTRQLGAHAYVGYFLRPFRPMLAARLFSHKVIRWLVPFFLLGAVAVNSMLLDDWFYRVTYAAALAGAVVFLVGWHALRRSMTVPAGVRLWVYFCVVNTAAFVGIVDFVRGRERVVWSASPSTRHP